MKKSVRIAATFGLSWAVALSLLIAPAPAEEGQESVHSFRIRLVSESTTTLVKSKFKTSGDISLDYTIRRKDCELTIGIDALEEQASHEGKEVLNRRLTRERIVNRKDGKIESDIAADKVTGEEKVLLGVLFGSPICKCKIDKEGKELKRTVPDSPEAKPITETGLIANLRLFHVPFPVGKDKWQTSRETAFSDGEFCRGDLTYEKLDAKKDTDRIKVKVTGTLANKFLKRPNGSSIRNVRIEVAGEQVYDCKKQEWVEGSLEMEESHELFVGEDSISSTTGRLKANLTSVHKE
jgi:hypothetical protein